MSWTPPPGQEHLILERIMQRTDEEGECLILRTKMRKDPTIHVPGRRGSIRARRAVWTLMGQGPAPGRFITNSCGHPLCIKPEHLVSVNPKAMSQRAGKSRGPLDLATRMRISKASPHRKYPDEVISAIRSSDLPTRELAAQYGMHRTTVNRIRKGRARAADFAAANPWSGLFT